MVRSRRSNATTIRRVGGSRPRANSLVKIGMREARGDSIGSGDKDIDDRNRRPRLPIRCLPFKSEPPLRAGNNRRLPQSRSIIVLFSFNHDLGTTNIESCAR